MKIGYPGNMFEIPAPSSGMGFSNNSDAETLQLDTGGRFIADRSTTYKSFNMSWRSSTPKLQPLIDIYNKRYGTKPFYIQDLNNGVGNILPPRWAYPHQLAAIHGACGHATAYGNFASFTSNRFAGSAPTLLVPVIYGRPLYLAVFRSFGNVGGNPMQYRAYTYAGEPTAWMPVGYTTPGDAPFQLLQANDTESYEFVELRVNLADTVNESIAIEHMDLSTSDYRSWDTQFRSAEGVGGLKFTNTLDGELVMLKSQRIGLSVDCTEVQ